MNGQIAKVNRTHLGGGEPKGSPTPLPFHAMLLEWGNLIPFHAMLLEWDTLHGLASLAQIYSTK